MWSKLLIDIFLGVRRILHGSERVPKGWPDILLSILELQKSVTHTFFVPCETGPMVLSKLLINIILGFIKILHESGRVSEGWTDLLLYIFGLKRSVIYQILCTLWDKSNNAIKITYGHDGWHILTSANLDEPL